MPPAARKALRSPGLRFRYVIPPSPFTPSMHGPFIP